ncbi:MAG: TonB-dependent receptor, partial [Acidimicrobiales bacterium]|nr:TonB-dependent receptor [Acidimicrobiales bacterium]
MYQLRPAVLGVALAYGGLLAPMALGPAAWAQQQGGAVQQMDRIEVTGTNIRRTDVEGSLPVTIITREELERSGKTTLTEVLTSLTVVSSGTFTETLGSGNSFAPATAAISLRGLGVNTVLVLLNGRRVANYGFAQNISEAFVDLNSIPLTAIERIEILKDGASAIYGSDAIAGVVNVILRKDFRGVEVSALAGTTQQGGGTEYRLSLAGGLGSLGADKYNVMAVLDYFRREEIKATDRAFSRSANQEPRGGFDQRSPSGNPGAAIVGGVAQPFPTCPPDNVVPDPAFPGNTCAYDFAPNNWLLPKTERIGLLLRGVYQFLPSAQAFAELGFNRNVTNQSAAPTPGAWTMPAASPFNPYGANALIRYRLVEAGPRLNEITSDSSRIVMGVKGEAGGWDIESAVNYSRNEVTNRGSNYIDNRNITRAFNGTGILVTNPDGSQTPGNFVPGFGPGTWYNPFNPSSNPQALIDALKVNPERAGDSDLIGFDIKGNREIFPMAGGPAAVALGFEAKKETLKDTPDPLSRLGVIAGSGGTSSQGDRSSQSAFLEFSLPFFKNFESQWALRYDQYSDFGATVNPKVGFSFKPVQSLLLRANAGSGFRAPSLVELYLGDSISFPNVVDTPRCNAYRAAFGNTDPRTISACTARQVRTSFKGNPGLDAERSNSGSVGFVFEPTESFSFGVDYFRITHRNRITSPTAAFLLNNQALFPGTVVRGPQTADDIAAGAPGALRGLVGDPDPTQPGILRSFFNSTSQEVKGADIEVRYRFNVPAVARFASTVTLTYLESFKAQANPGQPHFEYVDTYEFPRWRGVASITGSRGPLDVTLAINYLAGYEQFYGTAAGLPRERVSSFTTVDLQVQYAVSKNLRLAVGGANI